MSMVVGGGVRKELSSCCQVKQISSHKTNDIVIGANHNTNDDHMLVVSVLVVIVQATMIMERNVYVV